VGYPSTTPVAIVEKASTPQQRTLVGNLLTIPDIAKAEEAKPPAVVVVGEVSGGSSSCGGWWAVLAVVIVVVE